MSTYILRGFISYPSLINNDLGEVAPIGELSKHAYTYSRETGIHRNIQFPDTTLYAFDTQTSDGAWVDLPPAYRDTVLSFSRDIYADARQGRFSDDVNITHQHISGSFSNLIENLKLGEMVTNGDVWMPEWVSFNLKNHDAFIRLWFSDHAFQRQYGQYEYAFIPPVENLDDLHGSLTQVRAALEQRTYQKITEVIEQERGEYPYTRLIARQFAWVGETQEILTDWTVLVYGEAGSDYDSIRVALGEWIVANSSFTREEWLDVLPDIFAPTEFIITPLWHLYAIPNKTVQAGIHTPLVAISETDTILKKTLRGIGYTITERFQNTLSTTHPYKSLAIYMTGSGANRDGKHRISDHFSDYIHVSQQNPDFARMSPNTQRWIRKLSEMLFLSETLTETSLLPAGYYRVVREDVLYLGVSVDGILYLVVSRKSMHDLFGVDDDITPDDPLDPTDPDNEQVLSNMLTDHLNEDNPHAVTMSDFGLSLSLQNQTLITVKGVIDIL